VGTQVKQGAGAQNLAGALGADLALRAFDFALFLSALPRPCRGTASPCPSRPFGDRSGALLPIPSVSWSSDTMIFYGLGRSPALTAETAAQVDDRLWPWPAGLSKMTPRMALTSLGRFWAATRKRFWTAFSRRAISWALHRKPDVSVYLQQSHPILRILDLGQPFHVVT
jgi:hypothetical protein